MSAADDLAKDMKSAEAWSNDSWQRYEAAQQAEYPDPDALTAALQELEELPPVDDGGAEAAARAEEERKKKELLELWNNRRKK